MKTFLFLVVGSLLLFLTAVQTQPLSSSIPAGQDLVFQAGSPGLAELEDVPLGGSLTFRLAFKTGANNGQLLYMKEASVNHTISLYLSPELSTSRSTPTPSSSPPGMTRERRFSTMTTSGTKSKSRWKNPDLRTGRMWGF